MGGNLYTVENTEFSTRKIFRQHYISKPLHKFTAINSVPFQRVVQWCNIPCYRSMVAIGSHIYPNSQPLTIKPSAVLINFFE